MELCFRTLGYPKLVQVDELQIFVSRLNAIRFLSILLSSWTLNDNNYILA